MNKQIKTTDTFNYGQWTVTIWLRDYENVIFGSPASDEPYCAIDCTGTWRSTQGILYDKWRDCCAYDDPYILPTGLRKRVYKRAMKLINQCY